MKKAKQDLCQQGKLIWLRNKLAVTAAYGKHQCQAQMPIIPVEPAVRVGWLDTNIILTSLATNTRQWRCMDDDIDSIISEPKLLEEIGWLRLEQPSVWTNFLTISVTRLHQNAKKKKKSRRHKHNVQWQIWSWSLATGLWTMSIIQPPTRGIQRAQTQQITAAAGKYSLKTTSPVANCMPWQLRRHQPRLLSRLEQLDDSKVYLFFVLTVKIQCGARGGFLKPQSASKQKEMQPNILFLLVFW